MRDAAGNKVPCQRAPCRSCATECSLAGCNAVYLCTDCVPSENHKCGRVALLQLQAEIKEQSEADSQRKLEEQAAAFRAEVNALTTTSRQSQDSSKVAITTLQAKLESTMAISEELKRAKDQQAQALSETQTAARNHIAEQSRMLDEKMAMHEREQQRKTAENK